MMGQCDGAAVAPVGQRWVVLYGSAYVSSEEWVCKLELYDMIGWTSHCHTWEAKFLQGETFVHMECCICVGLQVTRPVTVEP
jgi:hypothetical protein